MCSRCVRFSNEITGAGELQFVERGNHVELLAFEDRALNDAYAGNLADVCPVGALTSRDFRFKRRVWFLRHAKSICAGCSTGCNIRIDYTDRIERVVPRRNPAVNQSWMCDLGRFSYHNVEMLPRLMTPLRRDDQGLQPASWDEALAAARQNLEAPHRGKSAIVASQMATNETLWLLRAYAHSLLSPAFLDFRLGPDDPDVVAREDALLLRHDKAPNSRGASMLGIGAAQSIEMMARLAEQGEIGLAVIVHYPPVVGEDDQSRLAALIRIAQSATFTIVLTNSVGDWWQAADVVLPLAAWSEEEGTYTNFARVTQHLESAVKPPEQVRPAWRILVDLLPQTSIVPHYISAEDIFDRGVTTMRGFEGLRYATLSSRQATAYPPEGRMAYGQAGFSDR